jgi:hypothetical protein
MLKIITSFLLLLTVFASIGFTIEANVPSLSDKEIAQLNELARHIEQGATEKNLLIHLHGNSYPIRAMSTAILYRLNQNAYESALQEEFSVNDYQARSRDEYNFILKEAMSDVIKNIENRYPQISDKRSQLLLAFCAFRQNNMWIRTDNGNISLARFFRTAFLAAVFKGTGLDAVAVADSIDQKTQKGN